ncbi:Ku domain protein [Labilithrix luteola]|uniref:Non-homologous end joining protein Ku n=1 Tax=Labilithrix luteola TaxID=1391654 RepID=A0A0K1QB97_9BACT|nr:Ku protein [Labilithrix luteola]AKV02942.1 Ku domain protein [Labilithrix luteola]
MARARAHARKLSEKSDAESEESTRAPSGRAIWSGSISFGLLQIPVGLYTAEQKGEELHFRMLDKSDLSPIRFQRVNAQTGKLVEWKDIVKGYEYERDNFVVLEPDDLAKANVKATQTIDIQDFVPEDEIDPAYFETPYYLVPQKRSTKAYMLLRQALENKGAIAIATFVLRSREHLCALMPVGNSIMLEMLRFGHELKRPSDLPLPTKSEAPDLSARELSMAEQLVEGMMTSFEPKKYRDRYYADVMKIIEEKVETGEATAHHEPARAKAATNVVDLLDLLKKSVAASGKASKARAANDETPRPKGPGPKKATPRKRTTRSKKTEAA